MLLESSSHELYILKKEFRIPLTTINFKWKIHYSNILYIYIYTHSHRGSVRHGLSLIPSLSPNPVGLYLIHGKILSSTFHLLFIHIPRLVACSTTPPTSRAAIGAWRGVTCRGPRKPRSKPPWTLAFGTRFQRDLHLEWCRRLPFLSLLFNCTRIFPDLSHLTLDASFLRTLSYLVPQACLAHGGDCCFEARLKDNCLYRMGLRNWWLRPRSWHLDDESTWFRDEYGFHRDGNEGFIAKRLWKLTFKEGHVYGLVFSGVVSVGFLLQA